MPCTVQDILRRKTLLSSSSNIYGKKSLAGHFGTGHSVCVYMGKYKVTYSGKKGEKITFILSKGLILRRLEAETVADWWLN